MHASSFSTSGARDNKDTFQFNYPRAQLVEDTIEVVHETLRPMRAWAARAVSLSKRGGVNIRSTVLPAELKAGTCQLAEGCSIWLQRTRQHRDEKRTSSNR